MQKLISKLTFSVILLSFFISLNSCTPTSVNPATTKESSVSPTITLWYGKEQRFGHRGITQDWINILGKVSGTTAIKWLGYSLNGGAIRSISIGPDGRRLQNKGDFNIDIALTELIPGENKILLSARNHNDVVSQESISLHYSVGSIWPLPDHLRWASIENLQDSVQLVDGLWSIGTQGLRTTEPGYDRFVAIGDVSWQDYEIEVPITMHDLSAEKGGVGILMRWTGHSDHPVPGIQPKAGFLPLGCIGWYRPGRLELYGNNSVILDRIDMILKQGQTYVFKMRVQTLDKQESVYSLKIWEATTKEPESWQLQGRQTASDPQRGSLLLTAHEFDVSFGDLSIQPVEIFTRQ
jgi:hypothetical protein